MTHRVNEALALSTSLPVTHGICSGRVDRWAVIMAGGDGTRLRSLTREIAGDDRPKQFSRILGEATLLDQTISRVGLSVPAAQTMFAVTQTHESFYDSHLSYVPRTQMVIQPKNAGTAPAILYSLLRVARVNPAAAVVFFPSDHYVSDDALFMSHVESAFDMTQTRTGFVILLGMEPDGPEAEYGWIEPVSATLTRNPDALSWVRRFWEKPTPELANKLMARGCLWNSFVMVGRVSAFLEMIRRASPDLYDRFGALEPYLGRDDEQDKARSLYSHLPDINFSRHILAARPRDLAVLPVTGLRWRDLGKPRRVLSTLADMGVKPAQAHAWNSASRLEATLA